MSIVISVSHIVKNLFLRMTRFRRVTSTTDKSSLVTSVSYMTKHNVAFKDLS